MLSPRLLSLATAVPEYVLSQDDAALLARKCFAERYDDFERLSRVFGNSGILKRYMVRPLEWYLGELGWGERTTTYLESASALFIKAAQTALDKAGLKASDIDSVVTVSSTGIATPSLEARVAQHMGFRPDIERVPVFGLGCAGGVTGLSIASRMAESRPGKNVLLVAVEICSLAFRSDEMTKANIVATALFGDGAAACILRSADSGGHFQIEMSGQHLWPDTIDIMGWNVDPQGFSVIFDRAIPPFAEENIAPAFSKILESAGLKLQDVDTFACHPGGAKVVSALERALSLAHGTLAIERDILREYGNMSAPTALFVLERTIEHGLPNRTLLTAMGPGFTAICCSLLRP